MSRVLSGAEQSVLKAIFEQRIKSQYSPIFEYNPKEAQLYLHSIGAFSEYDLDQRKQFDIIDKLTDEEIIKTDYLVDRDFINNLRAATGSKLPKIESNERYFWRRNSEWARERYKPDKLFDMNAIGERLGGSILIYMTTTDMRQIETQYIASRTIWLTLEIDGEDCVLRIKFGEDDWREIYRMKKNKTTSRILRLAFKHADKEVKTIHKYLESKVFRKNGPVRALNPILIKLDGDKIAFRTHADVAPAEFERLKKALNIA